MALFGESKKSFSYDVIREGEETILTVNCESYSRLPLLEDDPQTMAKTCDLLIEVKNVTKIVYSQKRNYEYDYEQTQVLAEIAQLYEKLTKQKESFSYVAFAQGNCQRWAPTWYAEVRHIVSDLLRSDPLGAYVELKRLEREERIQNQSTADRQWATCSSRFFSKINYILSLMDKTKMVVMTKAFLPGHKPGDREIYRRIFSPVIRPDFTFTRLMASYPVEGIELDNYTVGGDTEITIFQSPNTIQYLYHMIPPEFKLSEEEYEILDTARKIMAEHKPKRSEFVDPERMRQVFFNIGKDLIEELVVYKNMHYSSKNINKLTDILVRISVSLLMFFEE